jgi:chemotaxis protein MotB
VSALGLRGWLLVEIGDHAERLPLAHPRLPDLGLGIDYREPEHVVELIERDDLHIVRAERDVPLVLIIQRRRVVCRPPARGFCAHDPDLAVTSQFREQLRRSFEAFFPGAELLNGGALAGVQCARACRWSTCAGESSCQCMARKAAWEDLAEADLGPYAKSAGTRWGRVFVALLGVASATFVAAYYLPLYRAHQKLGEQYRELDRRAQSQSSSLAKAEAELKSMSAQRDQLQAERNQENVAQNANIARQESVRLALSSKLDKFLKKGTAQVASSGGSLLVAFSSALLFQPKTLEPAPTARALLCDMVKSAQAKSLIVRDSVAEGSALSAPLAKSYPSPWAFSAARAAVITQALEEGCGVPVSQLSAVGQGKYDPFAALLKLPGERIELELSWR